ncbi:MAG: hypothetical protein JNM93_11005 [Bacteriovoracaceae bacterium]|nr:hypothetical protein [Bacteriovoracaceae bacterium]
MTFAINQNVSELIKSKNDLHLSVYIPQTNGPADLKKYLRKAYKESLPYLDAVLNIKERNDFLKPLSDLINNYDQLKNFKYALGIFRTRNKFRVYSIPNEVQYTMITANSFHIKPLLHWMQYEKDFYLLGVGQSYACLYSCNQTEIKLVEKIYYSEDMVINKNDNFDIQFKKERKRMQNITKTSDWLTSWIMDILTKDKKFLYFAGDKEIVNLLRRNLPYFLKSEINQKEYFDESMAIDIVNKIRFDIKHATTKKIKDVVFEYQSATENEAASSIKRNLFTIARAAVKGKIKKLVISKEKKIFGKIDKNTGGLAIHYDHLDHEDDDLLDDIAQIVIENGGEVYVADKEQFPKGHAIMAILKPGKTISEGL